MDSRHHRSATAAVFTKLDNSIPATQNSQPLLEHGLPVEVLTGSNQPVSGHFLADVISPADDSLRKEKRSSSPVFDSSPDKAYMTYATENEKPNYALVKESYLTLAENSSSLNEDPALTDLPGSSSSAISSNSHEQNDMVQTTWNSQLMTFKKAYPYSNRGGFEVFGLSPETAVIALTEYADSYGPDGELTPKAKKIISLAAPEIKQAFLEGNLISLLDDCRVNDLYEGYLEAKQAFVERMQLLSSIARLKNPPFSKLMEYLQATHVDEYNHLLALKRAVTAYEIEIDVLCQSPEIYKLYLHLYYLAKQGSLRHLQEGYGLDQKGNIISQPTTSVLNALAEHMGYALIIFRKNDEENRMQPVHYFLPSTLKKECYLVCSNSQDYPYYMLNEVSAYPIASSIPEGVAPKMNCRVDITALAAAKWTDRYFHEALHQIYFNQFSSDDLTGLEILLGSGMYNRQLEWQMELSPKQFQTTRLACEFDLFDAALKVVQQEARKIYQENVFREYAKLCSKNAENDRSNLYKEIDKYLKEYLKIRKLLFTHSYNKLNEKDQKFNEQLFKQVDQSLAEEVITPETRELLTQIKLHLDLKDDGSQIHQPYAKQVKDIASKYQVAVANLQAFETTYSQRKAYLKEMKAHYTEALNKYSRHYAFADDSWEEDGEYREQIAKYAVQFAKFEQAVGEKARKKTVHSVPEMLKARLEEVMQAEIQMLVERSKRDLARNIPKDKQANVNYGITENIHEQLINKRDEFFQTNFWKCLNYEKLDILAFMHKLEKYVAGIAIDFDKCKTTLTDMTSTRPDESEVYENYQVAASDWLSKYSTFSQAMIENITSLGCVIGDLPNAKLAEFTSGNTLLHMAYNGYQAAQNKKQQAYFLNVMSILFQHGADCYAKNHERVIACELTSLTSCSSNGWKIASGQLANFFLFSELCDTVRIQLAEYCKANEKLLHKNGFFANRSTNQKIKQKRLQYILNLVDALQQANEKLDDSSVIDALGKIALDDEWKGIFADLQKIAKQLFIGYYKHEHISFKKNEMYERVAAENAQLKQEAKQLKQEVEQLKQEAEQLRQQLSYTQSIDDGDRFQVASVTHLSCMQSIGDGDRLQLASVTHSPISSSREYSPIYSSSPVYSPATVIRSISFPEMDPGSLRHR